MEGTEDGGRINVKRKAFRLKLKHNLESSYKRSFTHEYCISTVDYKEKRGRPFLERVRNLP